MKLVVLVLSGLLLSSSATAQWAPGGPLGVYDANGVLVGHWVGLIAGMPRVAVDVNGQPQYLSFTDIGWDAPARIFFASTDCTGDAYLELPGGPPPLQTRQIAFNLSDLSYFAAADGNFYGTPTVGLTLATPAIIQSVSSPFQPTFGDLHPVCEPATLASPPGFLAETVAFTPPAFVFPFEIRRIGTPTPAVPLLGLFLGALCFLAIAYWSFKRRSG